MCTVLAAIVAACNTATPVDLEERIEWYAEHIHDAYTATERDVYGWPNCGSTIQDAAEDVQLRNAERTYPNAVALLVAEAQLCVEHEAHADSRLAKLHATLDHVETANVIATAAVERRLAVPDGVEAARQADMIVEEFRLDDALHERVIQHLQDRLRQFRVSHNIDPERLASTNHPLD